MGPTTACWVRSGPACPQARRSDYPLRERLFRTPKVVIMDEPNAHLDAMGEADFCGPLRI